MIIRVHLLGRIFSDKASFIHVIILWAAVSTALRIIKCQKWPVFSPNPQQKLRSNAFGEAICGSIMIGEQRCKYSMSHLIFGDSYLSTFLRFHMHREREREKKKKRKTGGRKTVLAASIRRWSNFGNRTNLSRQTQIQFGTHRPSSFQCLPVSGRWPFCPPATDGKHLGAASHCDGSKKKKISINQQMKGIHVSISIYLSIYPSIHLSIYHSISISISISFYIYIILHLYLYLYLSLYLSIYLPTYLPTYLSIHPSNCLSISLSVCMSIYLSIYLSNLIYSILI